MKITETIERECCDFNKDLIPYNGKCSIPFYRHKPKFCRVCGQIWINVRRAGEMDAGYEKCKELDVDLI